MSGSPLLSWRGEERLEDLDMADVIGMEDARYALEVAAAGGHHLMLTGPKGSGKTTLAERIPGLLPDLADDESLELTAVHSLSGALPAGASRLVRPPFRAPHHSASRTGILGGGSGRVRPGEVSKAHLGVLFLDEFPLFPSDVVEALREPLEAGEISISRGEEDATYPARAMFVFACNPCRCGDYHAVLPRPPVHLLGAEAARVPAQDLRADRRPHRHHPVRRADAPRAQRERADLPFDRPEPSAADPGPGDGRARAPTRALRGPAVAAQRACPGTDAARALAAVRRGDDCASTREVHAGRLTRRGAVRVHRVAWSVADLAGVDRPGAAELDVALRLRSATPLLMSSIPAPTGHRSGGRRMSEVRPTVSEPERLARVALSRIGEPGDPRLTDLVHELGARDGAGEPAASRSPTVSWVTTWPSGSPLPIRRGSSRRPRRGGSGSSYPGTRSGPPGSTTSPGHRTCTSGVGSPSGVWCRGPLRLDEAVAHAVAVVGSRSATTYGGAVAGDIASVLATESWTVVSGAAFGIDQAAHRGALANRGPTVAVLACGVDRAYPTAHRNLIDYIADVGLVVSEAAPGCAPTRIRFLARNRLIAAMSAGTVVVEAAVRSGALNTASWAAGTGRTGDGGARPGHQCPVRRGAPADPGPRRRARDLGRGGPRARRSDGRLHAWPTSASRTDRATGWRRGSGRCSMPSRWCRRSTPARSPARPGIAHVRTKEALLVLHREGLVEHSLGRWRLAGDPAGPSAGSVPAP